VPRFDSPACFAALLGGPEHGRRGLAPRNGTRSVERRYRDDTLVLETRFETGSGAVTVVDCMLQRDGPPVVIRQVVGVRGTVAMRMELVIRMDYGSVVPWVRRSPRGIRAVAGPNALLLTTDVPLHGEALSTVSDFTIAAGPSARERVRPVPAGRGLRERAETRAPPGSPRRRTWRRARRSPGPPGCPATPSRSSPRRGRPATPRRWRSRRSGSTATPTAC